MANRYGSGTIIPLLQLTFRTIEENLLFCFTTFLFSDYSSLLWLILIWYSEILGENGNFLNTKLDPFWFIKKADRIEIDLVTSCGRRKSREFN